MINTDKICAKTPRKAHKFREIQTFFTPLHHKFPPALCKHWCVTLSSSAITTHIVFFAVTDTARKDLDLTHLIKVEQHFSPIQLISLQTHSLVHKQLLRETRKSRYQYVGKQNWIKKEQYINKHHTRFSALSYVFIYLEEVNAMVDSDENKCIL